MFVGVFLSRRVSTRAHGSFVPSEFDRYHRCPRSAKSHSCEKLYQSLVAVEDVNGSLSSGVEVMFVVAAPSYRYLLVKFCTFYGGVTGKSCLLGFPNPGQVPNPLHQRTYGVEKSAESCV